MVRVLNDIGLKPLVSFDIKTWLITHYVLAAGLSAGIIKAGCGNSFANDPKLIRRVVKSVREGFNVCKSRGIDPKSEKANRPYYIPLFILVPVLKRVYSNEALCLMFDGHTKHAPNEMAKMLNDIIQCGEINNIAMPYTKGLQKDITRLAE